jgi:hypothetical protein
MLTVEQMLARDEESRRRHEQLMEMMLNLIQANQGGLKIFARDAFVVRIDSLICTLQCVIARLHRDRIECNCPACVTFPHRPRGGPLSRLLLPDKKEKKRKPTCRARSLSLQQRRAQARSGRPIGQ